MLGILCVGLRNATFGLSQRIKAKPVRTCLSPGLELRTLCSLVATLSILLIRQASTNKCINKFKLQTEYEKKHLRKVNIF